MAAPGRPWTKGQSGNPTGRPRGSSGFSEAIRKATKDGRELWEYALRVVRGEETSSVVTKDGAVVEVPPTIMERLKAVDWMSRRGFGREPDAVIEESKTDGDKDDEGEVLRLLNQPPEESNG